MDSQRPRSEFTDVDQAQRPVDYIRMLDAQQFIPFSQQYKQHVRTLLDLREPVRIVIRIRHLRLARDRHGRSPARVVVGIGHLRLTDDRHCGAASLGKR